MKFGRERNIIAFICVLHLLTYVVIAHRRYKSSRRKPMGMYWKSRYMRHNSSPLKSLHPPGPIPSCPPANSSISLCQCECPGSCPVCNPPKPPSPPHKQAYMGVPCKPCPPCRPSPPAPSLSPKPPDRPVKPPSCNPDSKVLSPYDPTSYSRPEQASITHMSLKLNVDFHRRVLDGKVTLYFHVNEDINELPLDVNCLKIDSVEMPRGVPLSYNIEGDYPENRATLTMGSKLLIRLADRALIGDKLKIIIMYSTDPEASALSWLKPFQTSGLKYPYLFSQSSPIHARSIVPCQDTPSVRFTYDAAIMAPEDLTVVMSALKGPVLKNKSLFKQPVPIPSMLLAIAVGKLECRPIGPRSKVWAEKEDVQKCAAEFSETEKYLQAAEKICGPYDWKVYDILVLPLSYSHGAMENPCLTFVSPTIVVGDKSLVSVVIHEITHSWTGNAVSIKNFEHFWLNEGFAVFLQRKISVYLMDDAKDPKIARQHLDMSYVVGLQLLNDTIKAMDPTNPLTQMVVKLEGVHPADSFSIVPYEKGAIFLKYLEDLLGGPKTFEKFICVYIRKFHLQSLDSDAFKAFLIKWFKNNEKLKLIDWNSWYYNPGMPPVIPDLDRTFEKPVVCLVEKIQDPDYKFSCKDVKDFSMTQIMYLLELLLNKPPMAVKRLRALGKEYSLETYKNKEIISRWLRLCIRSKDKSKVPDVFNFLKDLGRLSYVRPMYSDLYAWDEYKNTTVKYFLEHERFITHTTAYNLRKDLHLS